MEAGLLKPAAGIQGQAVQPWISVEALLLYKAARIKGQVLHALVLPAFLARDAELSWVSLQYVGMYEQAAGISEMHGGQVWLTA